MDPFPIDLVIAPNDPNVWDILTAIGTVGAVVVAVALGLIEQRRASIAQQTLEKDRRAELVRLELERDDALVARARAEQIARQREFEAQARAVSVWFEPRTNRQPTQVARNTWRHLDIETIRVANHSQAPIFNVQLGIVTQLAVRIDAGAPFRAVDRDGRVNRDLPALGEHADDPRLAFVSFRDASGTTWERHSNGRLVHRPVADLEGFFEPVPD